MQRPEKRAIQAESDTDMIHAVSHIHVFMKGGERQRRWLPLVRITCASNSLAHLAGGVCPHDAVVLVTIAHRYRTLGFKASEADATSVSRRVHPLHSQALPA